MKLEYLQLGDEAVGGRVAWRVVSVEDLRWRRMMNHLRADEGKKLTGDESNPAAVVRLV